MLYLTCTMIFSVDLAHYRVSRFKDWVSGDCGTSGRNSMVCAPVRSLSLGIIDRTGAQTMLYLTCTTIPSVVLAHYRVSRAEDLISGDCGTKSHTNPSSHAV